MLSSHRQAGFRVAATAFLMLSVATAGCSKSDSAMAPTPGTVAPWLQQHPALAAAVVWDEGDGSGPLPYPSWSSSNKAALEQAVAVAAAEPPLADPPTNQVATLSGDDAPAVTVLSPGDARALYFASVGRSLMLEMTNGLPWSIANYSPTDLAVLLDSRAFFLYKKNVFGTSVSGYAVYDNPSTDPSLSDPTLAVSYVLPAPPAVAARFLASNGIVAGDRLTTIVRLLEWERSNMSHFGDDFTARNVFLHWQYRGSAPVSRIIAGTANSSGYTPPLFSHWTVGCPGTNQFMMAVLRAVNIPVRYLVVEQHATPYFPTEGKYLDHGDNPYSRAWATATPTIPASALLIDEATYQARFSPALTRAQRLSGIGRTPWELSITQLTDWTLVNRCDDLAAGRTSHASSKVYSDVARFYTLVDLESMDLWNRLDAKIASRGGCGAIKRV